MTSPGWLHRSLADVPADDGWLTEAERAVLAALRVPKRREDWRLGRWTAKAAVSALTGAHARRIAIVAAEDGAPEAFVDGRPAGVSLSLSHRAGRAIAAVGSGAIGCDLELVEPRSRAFAEDWLTPAERDWAADDALRTNLVWAAKEAWVKLRREGLRLDPRAAEATIADTGVGWRPLVVAWEGPATRGWWRADDVWIVTVVSEPPAGPPRDLRPDG